MLFSSFISNIYTVNDWSIHNSIHLTFFLGLNSLFFMNFDNGPPSAFSSAFSASLSILLLCHRFFFRIRCKTSYDWLWYQWYGFETTSSQKLTNEVRLIYWHRILYLLDMILVILVCNNFNFQSIRILCFDSTQYKIVSTKKNRWLDGV